MPFPDHPRSLTWPPVKGEFDASEERSASARVRTPRIPWTEDILPQSLLRAFHGLRDEFKRSGRWRQAEMEEVKAICRAEGAPDYSRLSRAFFGAYFGANAAKAMACMLSEPRLSGEANTIRILDLGAGSGATSAGLLAGLLRLRRPPAAIHIDMVESNPMQLDICKEILGRWSTDLPASTTFSHIPSDVTPFLRSQNAAVFDRTLPKPAQYDLVASSYLITELSREQAADLMFELLLLCSPPDRLGPSLLMLGSYEAKTSFGYLLWDAKGKRSRQSLMEVLLKSVGIGL